MIELPILALLDRSRNGIIRVVFVAYNELEDLLTIPNQRSVVEIVDKPKSLVINSRVLSASLNQYGTQNLNLPVKLTFRHIQEENVTNLCCVFWDFSSRQMKRMSFQNFPSGVDVLYQSDA
ncbi:latrophilin Cirl-like isoform X2 [Limulus polyphemus]|uniref:Latrophilin Cirl-like isoform X2 n=1 Tax=Limulus polyphemus TaxID=6850 RepID=A0ABM1S8S2_LIMPO|nr:latrophilin Cirl-like isoform X2 [Limulus polyphemus]